MARKQLTRGQWHPSSMHSLKLYRTGKKRYSLKTMREAVQSGFDYNRENQFNPPKNIGIFLFDGVEPMDFMGPLCVFDSWQEISDDAPKVFTFSINGKIKCDYGREHITDKKASDLIKLDAILIPGGRGRDSVTSDPKMLEYIFSIGKDCKYILSVCTGTFILKDSGLIHDEKVTTHNYQIKNLRDESKLNVIEDVECAADKNIWTSSGVFCGTIMSLGFVKSFEGYKLKDGTDFSGVHDKICSDIQHPNYFPNTLP